MERTCDGTPTSDGDLTPGRVAVAHHQEGTRLVVQWHVHGGKPRDGTVRGL